MESPTHRQEQISWWHQKVLREARIGVVGAGALGNEAIKNLALMGVGRLDIFDKDRIEITNLSRSVLYDRSLERQPKAFAAAARAKAMNVYPESEVEGHNLDVVWDLGGRLLSSMSVVLGCLDNLAARVAVGRHCYQLGIPYIDGGIAELNGRVQLHLTGHGACMYCSLNPKERKQLGTSYSCFRVIKDAEEAGVVPTVQICSAFIATLMCQEAIKHLHGKTVKWGHIISWHGETNSFDVLQLQKNSQCDTCRFPPPPTQRIPYRASDSAQNLLDYFGSDAEVYLPQHPGLAGFVEAAICGNCGTSRSFDRPAWRILEGELDCPQCKTWKHIDLKHRGTISALSPEHLRNKPLLDLGVPPLGSIFVTRSSDVILALLEG